MKWKGEFHEREVKGCALSLKAWVDFILSVDLSGVVCLFGTDSYQAFPCDPYDCG